MVNTMPKDKSPEWEFYITKICRWTGGWYFMPEEMMERLQHGVQVHQAFLVELCRQADQYWYQHTY